MAKGDTLAKVCLGEYSFHRYGEDGKCIRPGCGMERQSRASSGERAPARGPRAPSKAQIKQSLAMLIFGAQKFAIGMFPGLQEDELSRHEIAMLADVLADEAEAHPEAKRWIARVQTSSVHARLAFTLAMIAMPRLARRGILPEGIDEGIDEFVLATMAVAPGGAPGGDRGDGLGEIDPDGTGPEHAPLFYSGADEAGRRPVSSSNGKPARSSRGGPKVRSHRAATATGDVET